MAPHRSRPLALVLLFTSIAAPATAHADVLLAPLVWRIVAPGGGGGAPAGRPSGAYAKEVEVTGLGDVAGAASKIDLPQLLQTAVRQSPALATATIDVEIAEAQLESALGLDDWIVDASVQGQNTLGLGFLGVSTNRNLTLSLGMTRPLSTGGSVGFTAFDRYDYSHTPADPTTTPATPEFNRTSYTVAVAGVLTQPLLRGRGREVARALQIENALLEDAAKLTRRQEAINIIQSVVTSYWDLVSAQRTLEIARGSLQLAQERLRVTQIGVNGGKIADSELLAVEEAIATRQEDVLNSEVAVLQQSLTVRRSIGMEIGPGQIILDGGAALDVPARSWNLEDILAQSLHSSPQLASLAKSEANATIAVDVTENGLLPQLDLSLQVGPTGNGVSQADALSDLAKLNGIYAQGSLVFQQRLGRHQVRGQVMVQRAQREKIRVNAQDVKLQITQAVAQAIALVRAAEQRVQLGHRAVELAQKNIVVEQSRFELGKSTNFDVLLRQDELRQAQLREARAQVDWHKAQAIIAALTGSILVDYGIDLRDR